MSPENTPLTFHYFCSGCLVGIVIISYEIIPTFNWGRISSPIYPKQQPGALFFIAQIKWIIPRVCVRIWILRSSETLLNHGPVCGSEVRPFFCFPVKQIWVNSLANSITSENKLTLKRISFPKPPSAYKSRGLLEGAFIHDDADAYH